MKRIFCVAGMLIFCCRLQAQRQIVSLNGVWQIEDSVDSLPVPTKYTHHADVPGLVRTSVPAFQDVDRFVSYDYNNYEANPRRGSYDISDPRQLGIPLQKRNYFWYRRTFALKHRTPMVVLKVNKAQFGSAIWINHHYAGGNLSGCTAGYYDITGLVRFDGEPNEIDIRIGAHPGVLPYWMYAGKDDDKRCWTPGIWDDVSLIATGNPYIAGVQVAPDINRSLITVQADIQCAPPQRAFSVSYIVREWKTGREVAAVKQKDIRVNPSSRMRITTQIAIPHEHLWSPDDPFLYTVGLKTPGDNVTTRFGMRELRFDTKTRKAYLNNRIFYMRGSNIALHRFFDDSLCRKQPWDEQWVHRLLVDIPGQFHWNTFRTHLGLVPEHWLDVADENGILIQYEMQTWGVHSFWNKDTFRRVVEDWMRDSWNHPSVIIWDMCNESRSPMTAAIIKQVRGLDLSHRPWDDGYNLPQGEDDPTEDHHYLKFFTKRGEIAPWRMEYYEQTVAPNGTRNTPFPTVHATILNEYAWFFTHRDGSPGTAAAQQLDMLCPGCTDRQRRAFAAYMTAAETEYFRAHRNYAGVLHFVYLTGDYAGSATGDILQDANIPTVDPYFSKYLTQAFKPLGVYLNFWRTSLAADTTCKFAVMLTNDTYKADSGELKILIARKDDGQIVLENSQPYRVEDISGKSYLYKLHFPLKAGAYVMTATATTKGSHEGTVSTRFFNIR